ncbi:hypothetical protein KL907_002466 [Ogataea polymorpha]|uniref:uncharacterized protein n=1 Tax=Ogataea polymorpha TaxID=460523 RepID=UPI0007F53DC9|nr:uncharacterized protein OGAPODRAFT_10806 [Ogataea polymorpha]KAG7880749.1 hypothetical protein KL937_002311 [Ogataea polymorpha]KAG7906826.1 hypothetical protein KL907_002466 [Ogataea polymorpha]KAG7934815.1 hypothetical protein KL934_002741 [Ogataea polymorpha]KAG7936181.1 hypothetical protein KL904_002829 [Ogataea polymorpha]OBA18215.1 hypothetical protein OGAPODRAFT_10806 [Ogataea polymorpha]
MSSLSQSKVNQNKENALHSKSNDLRSDKSISRKSSKSVLRTKSSNAIVKPQEYGNYNKVRKTSTLNDLHLFDNDPNAVAVRKFKVQRDSPQFKTKHKLSAKEEFDDDDDAIEIVPAAEDELPYVPNTLTPIPDDLLDDILNNKRKSTKSIDDPLELDLSYLKDMEEQDSLEGAFKSNELVLEFPEEGEETESKKLDKIREETELHHPYKPKRL